MLWVPPVATAWGWFRSLLGLSTAAEATGTIGEQVAQRVVSEGALRTSATVARQLAGARGFIPVQAITAAIATGSRVADPQGVAGQFMYTAEAAFNDSVGTLEVLVNEDTNIIVHVLFRSH